MSGLPSNVNEAATAGSVATERHVGQVRGTRDRLQADYARLLGYERTLLDRFARAGYRPARTPILELSDLHERKSGAGIVGKLFEVSGAGTAGICLRPELTAGLVRAYVEAEEPPALPWRASVSGPVFRFRSTGRGLDREFVQTGVELIGAGGPAADAELIWLADWSLQALGVASPKIRVGHVGLILELLGRAGLPAAATAALVESLSEAASEGKGVHALEAALDRLTTWLGSSGTAEEAAAAFATPAAAPEPAVDRLFRHLVPDVAGRRSAGEIVGRLRRKWALEHSLHDALGKVRDLVRDLADLRGPAAEVLDRLDRRFAGLAPESTAAIRELAAMLEDHGVDLGRVELDLGFGRGIGFYTQMIFELSVDTPDGPVEVCGGGRYDGLARVLGGRDRDDRGAGFAFGLERLDQALKGAGEGGGGAIPPEVRGVLVTGGGRGLGREAAITAAFLRERLDAPVVLADPGPAAAEGYARGLGLGRIVAAGPDVEAWDLDPNAHGLRPIEGGEWLEQIRGRLAAARREVR
ncbi:ATP phosphoribosyltransferase regulatory subunit [Planctomyces sp. SH-PL62]|uniref:ATP phosphoribosyltransferase regulatory subunit n=1 Tax=Planctomyces sp. SH-PL62 TaxID=1636152 RepID=UPI00078CDCEC|nr:ATP phosphoribosyltransferase regulatory subunit [Planctomyces sp. SH-PL62]AMV36570.1 Histidine--tRNA ligase [Planctomyces sp. SH-PL62]